MKKVISILITLCFLASCSSGIKNEVVGTWIGTYKTKVTTPSESDLTETDSILVDSIIREYFVDTTHTMLSRVLEFESNGQFSSIGWDIIRGKWKEKDNEISIITDSLEFKATISKNKMIIELKVEDVSQTYYYERVMQPNRSSVERNDYLGKCWEIDLNDTNRLIYNFLDTNNVIITSQFGTHYGHWYNFNSEEIQCIYTYSFDTDLQTNTYILKESGESKTNQYIFYGIPKEYVSQTTELLPLSSTDYKSLKAQLIGNWMNKERFYPFDTLIDDESKLIDFKYTLVFEDSLFKMRYSGKNKETLKLYEQIINGKWTLDEYGNYITLYYQGLYKNKKYDYKKFLTLYSVGEKELEMTLGFRSLITNTYYGGERIEMIKEYRADTMHHN